MLGRCFFLLKLCLEGYTLCADLLFQLTKSIEKKIIFKKNNVLTYYSLLFFIVQFPVLQPSQSILLRGRSGWENFHITSCWTVFLLSISQQGLPDEEFKKNVMIIPVFRRSWGGEGGGIWFRSLGFRRTNTASRPQLIYVHEIMEIFSRRGGGGGLTSNRGRLYSEEGKLPKIITFRK